MVILHLERLSRKWRNSDAYRQGRRPRVGDLTPLETQRLEGAIRPKPFHLEERTRKYGLCDAIAEGSLPQVTSEREKHAVINASTIARSFYFAWEKKYSRRWHTSIPWKIRRRRNKKSWEACRDREKKRNTSKKIYN